MFKGINVIPARTTLRFMTWRRSYFAFTAVLMAASIALFLVRGLNYGIDFTGGILIEVQTPQSADLGAMRSSLSGLGLGDVQLQTFGAPNEVLIRVQRQEGDEKAQAAAVERIKQALGDGLEYRRTEFVGPQVSQELFMDGVYAVSFALLAMLVYIWFRFEWQFATGAVLALLHDIIATIGVFSLTGMEFNLSTVAAVLTIAGYSINDTVVIYDRVRENLRKFKVMPLDELLDRSVNDTLSRTVMTSGTTLVALLALYFLGGEVIRGFSFAMIFGILVGTYSSVCFAVPLLLYTNLRRGGESDAADPSAEGDGEAADAAS